MVISLVVWQLPCCAYHAYSGSEFHRKLDIHLFRSKAYLPQDIPKSSWNLLNSMCNACTQCFGHINQLIETLYTCINCTIQRIRVLICTHVSTPTHAHTCTHMVWPILLVIIWFGCSNNWELHGSIVPVGFLACNVEVLGGYFNAYRLWKNINGLQQK